jgi:hypothetical protein
MSNNNITFWSSTKSGFDYDLDRLFKSIEGTIGECTQEECDLLHTALFEHLVAIRDTIESFDKKIEARQEAERQTELSAREEILLETEDGEMVKFNAPYGFDSPSIRGSSVYTFDLYGLRFNSEGKIEAAFDRFHGDRRLTPEELDMCNSLFVRM